MPVSVIKNIITLLTRRNKMSTIQELHEVAKAQAEKVTKEWIDNNGEPFCCGFAWVVISVERTNSKLAKEFLAVGFTKDYLPRRLILWNPSGHGTQSVDPKYAGAQAYAKVFRDAGYNVFASSRLD